MREPPASHLKKKKQGGVFPAKPVLLSIARTSQTDSAGFDERNAPPFTPGICFVSVLRF